MTAPPTTDDLTWPAPGPGQWAAMADHWPTAVTPWLQRLVRPAQERAMASVFARYGIPARTLAVGFVNDHLYTRLTPIGPDKPSRRPPPAALLKVLLRIHPEMRRRAAAARRSVAEHPWRAETARWFDGDREVWRQRNLGLQAIDPASLEDAGLARHVHATANHCGAAAEAHFALHGPDLVPIALLLVAAGRWGIPHDELLSLLEGASPATASVLGPLERLAAVLDEAGADPSSLDEVRAVSPEAAGLLDDYLAERRWCVVTGYDVESLTLGELPGVVLQSLARRRTSSGSSRASAGDGTGVDASIAAARERVPDSERSRFDTLVADARLTHGLRDDNGPILVEWPLGLLRRALLEVGRRLTARGSLADEAHVFELDEGEVDALLLGSGGPAAAAVAERAETRRRHAAASAPRLLGPDEAPPPIEALPPEMGELLLGVDAVLSLLNPPDHEHPDTASGIGREPYVGRARVARTAEEAVAAVEPGDVLVVPFTTPTYNMVLAAVGGLVTEEGGPLSHAAVIARELGIPAVVGLTGATVRIADGSLVEVDPVAARVRVVEAAPA